MHETENKNAKEIKMHEKKNKNRNEMQGVQQYDECRKLKEDSWIKIWARGASVNKKRFGSLIRSTTLIGLGIKALLTKGLEIEGSRCVGA
jgi:hypothetical protein